MPPGEYTLEATVDPENLVAEKDETNNVATAMVTVPELGQTDAGAMPDAGVDAGADAGP